MAKLCTASPGECIHSEHNGVKPNLIILIISKFMTSKTLAHLSAEAEHNKVPLELEVNDAMGTTTNKHFKLNNLKNIPHILK